MEGFHKKAATPDSYRGSHITALPKQYKTKNPHQINDEDFLKKGSDILSHVNAVPSAQSGLTSLFGMGRGEPRRNNHLKRFCKGD